MKTLADYIHSENAFLVLITLLLVGCGVALPYRNAAMWVGFMIAGYSVVANDSLQCLGTWLSSNKQRPWWALWAYVAAIFAVTHLYGWYAHNGDVSYGRLTAKGLEKAPDAFDYLQITAPIFLLVLTRLRIPVSTTLLILSSFATKASTVGKIIFKSLFGYFVAFTTSVLGWPLLRKLITKYGKKRPHKAWVIAQWLTSGALWSLWLVQDAANIAVFLPRSLSTTQVTYFTVYMVIGLGLLLYMRGGRIQSVVESKTMVQDVRHATLIDGMYAMVLYYFKIRNKMPMSTTWVFLGNLGGRELGLSLIGKGKSTKKSKNIIMKDIAYATIGLVVSLLLAVAVNPLFKDAFLP